MPPLDRIERGHSQAQEVNTRTVIDLTVEGSTSAAGREFLDLLLVGSDADEDCCLEEIGELIDPRADDLHCYALPLRGFPGRIGRTGLPPGIVGSGLPAAMD